MATALTCVYEDRTLTIEEAMEIKANDDRNAFHPFRCIECGEPVRPHRSGGHAAAHFEHLSRNAACSLSHKYSGPSSSPSPNVGDDWSSEELRASVAAYIEMQRKARAGERVIKKRYYSELHAKFGRTEKSYEFRMQNISFVLSVMGREWLTGLKPAKNVGTRVAVEIERLINELGGVQRPPVVSFELSSRDESKQRTNTQPSGNQQPRSSVASITQYQRDFAVKGWVLRKACGICECCGLEAPFLGSDGQPYLEVHHVQQLADGGPDTTANTVALCPNCHREIHYGVNSKALVERLYSQVKRLSRE